MRPVLRDMILATMQTAPDIEWPTKAISDQIQRTPNGIRGVLHMLHSECLIDHRAIAHKSYIESRWILTPAGMAVEILPREVKPPTIYRVPSRWPGRDHEALEAAWPHPVTVPVVGTKRKHTMEGGWA